MPATVSHARYFFHRPTGSGAACSASIPVYTSCSSALSCCTRVYSHSFRSASAGDSVATCGSHTRACAMSAVTLARTRRSSRASSVSRAATTPRKKSALIAAHTEDVKMML